MKHFCWKTTIKVQIQTILLLGDQFILGLIVVMHLRKNVKGLFTEYISFTIFFTKDSAVNKRKTVTTEKT